MEFKIVDFEKKGNLVRFFLTNDETKLKESWGDDWDDAPYDCNAGEVYDRYFDKIVDIAFDGDMSVLEPCDGYRTDCRYSKDDMKKRNVPCIVVGEDSGMDDFSVYVGAADVERIYFGDTLKEKYAHEIGRFEKDLRDPKAVK